MRDARIPRTTQSRRWRDMAADAAAVATLFSAGAVLYAFLCPLDAYAASKTGQVCMTGDGYTAMLAVWTTAGGFIGMLAMALFCIANRPRPQADDHGFAAGGRRARFEEAVGAGASRRPRAPVPLPTIAAVSPPPPDTLDALGIRRPR